ncbi:hypothetical protein ACKKBF_B16175 [Auxenochlorella protothecoides x Auxenochlorella symbiontica]
MLPLHSGPPQPGTHLSHRGSGQPARRARNVTIPSTLQTAVAVFMLFALLVALAYRAVGSDIQVAPASSRRLLRDSSFSRARKFPVSNLSTLILVAGHSVYTGLDYHDAQGSSSWYLLDYQKEVKGQTESFMAHIRLGVEQAAADPKSVLLFSGGKTRASAGPRAEAEGYWLVAEANDWFGFPEVRRRAFTEEKARDSFENLLFGLCRYYELTGHHPTHVTVVGYEFKKARFQDMHRAAVRYPATSFSYVGTPALTPSAVDGEAAAAAAFRTDPYGCSGALAAKRAERDPFAEGGYGPDRCPAMAGLLNWCGPDPFPGRLPWAPRR